MDMEDLTREVIGAGIEVHRMLGPGFLESIYEKAMTVQLRARGIPFQRQVEVPIQFKTVDVGLHRLDLVVPSQLVVELEAVRELVPEHFVVVRSYLRAAKLPLALLLNFGTATLEPRRVCPREPA
jgi:GxxExxY protein